MKRIVSILLVLTLVLSFAACGKTSTTSSRGSADKPTTSQGKEKQESQTTLPPAETPPATTPLSDSDLKWDAGFFLQKIASDIKNEYRNDGYNTFQASPRAITTIVSRTDDTVTIQGEIEYWFNGGSPDGSIIVTIIMDRYSGDVIDYYYK